MEEELPEVIHAQVTVSYNVESILDTLDEEFKNLEGVVDWIDNNAIEDLSLCVNNYVLVGDDGQEL